MDEETNKALQILDKWYVVNAGLILTHPFLTQLFKVLEYLGPSNQFKNEELQSRAVYLLHYLSTGQNDEINETELAISKILCGMSIQNPIRKNIKLDATEKEMADELLTVLISRWEKLGNTSIDGLRQTFLQRNGVLEEKEEIYQLLIETSGTDILLDFIPWNISSIKPQWIKNIIYVSWR